MGGNTLSVCEVIKLTQDADSSGEDALFSRTTITEIVLTNHVLHGVRLQDAFVYFNLFRS